MGTRGLTAVVLDGEYKVAQYGQWDHYPTGQGVNICRFISETMDLDRFKQAVRECKWISEEVRKQAWVDCGAEPDAKSVPMDVSRRFAHQYPHLSRDAGSKVLEMIQDNGARLLQDDLEFAADSLFCEYAYVLDLDNEVLEIYKGFNTTELAENERFAFLNDKADKEPNSMSGQQYKPVSLLRKLPFWLCSEYAMKQLEKTMEEDENGNTRDPKTLPDAYFVKYEDIKSGE